MVKITWLAKCYECATLVKVPDPDNPEPYYLCPRHEDKDNAA